MNQTTLDTPPDRSPAMAGPEDDRPAARGWFATVRRERPGLIEVAIFALALLVYQGSRVLVMGQPSLAFENAAHIISWERSSGLFVESSVQEWMLNHVQLTEMLNYFYMSAHWIVTILFFVWLFHRHRRVYPYVRNAFLFANGIALIVYAVFPVAPPRLMGGHQFVDTLSSISDIDLQGGMFAGLFNPHAAVPSMHFGYAFMIAMVMPVLVRSWPLRLVALAYPAVVLLTIVGTANHYITDALAGGVVIATGFFTIYLWMMARGRLSEPSSDPDAARRLAR
ncbi:MAG TPA: phosphatase PAP2 family protein [Miltoncostaeaceae bacterium]|nr:phosphatase PAP2 family protein [Miltoncostaeaceae bacterium]